MAAAWRRVRRSAASTESSQRTTSAWTSPVTPALVASVTCRAPPSLPPTGSRPPTSRWCRSTARRPAPVRGQRRRGWTRAWWPTCSGPAGSLRPGGPGMSRRCAGPASRCPGPTGPAGRALPHHRGGPLVGDPHAGHRPPVGQRGAGHRQHRPGDGLGVHLDQAGGRGGRQDAGVVDVGHRGVGPDDGRPHPRGADVDHQQAASAAAGAAPRPATLAERLGSPSLPGFKMPAGSSAALRSASTVRPAPGPWP